MYSQVRVRFGWHIVIFSKSAVLFQVSWQILLQDIFATLRTSYPFPFTRLLLCRVSRYHDCCQWDACLFRCVCWFDNSCFCWFDSSCFILWVIPNLLSKSDSHIFSICNYKGGSVSQYTICIFYESQYQHIIFECPAYSRHGRWVSDRLVIVIRRVRFEFRFWCVYHFTITA